jgi:glucose-6-phosphate isomerase
MNETNQRLWARYQQYYIEFSSADFALDLSRMNFGDDFFTTMSPQIQEAFEAMNRLEKGAVSNPDEKRMVGHYWLRNAELAPTAEIKHAIETTVSSIKDFAQAVHQGKIVGSGGNFLNVLLIGIGGSALGPLFVSSALGDPTRDTLKLYAFDNTDPDGMDRVLAQLGAHLGQTLCLIISKSGGTKETRNGMLEAKAAYEKAGLDFGRHAVAVTSLNSELDKVAVKEKWITRFPMWDWVGGRTSQLSAVGLLPAALQGIDIDQLLAGAKACDILTRIPVAKSNPAALLALMWYYVGNGKGDKAMVVLPYKDRLELFSKYLQQLIMESLGKELDTAGHRVNQGLSVFGNKGSSDQHSYIQQLREGLNNFFVTFIRVLKDRKGASQAVDPGVTSGDYLDGFFQGTRRALFENGRQSITITIKEVTPLTVGALIALFERTVGLYATMIRVNAYHQPGVEAGKKAANTVITLQLGITEALKAKPGVGLTAAEIAQKVGNPDEVETVFLICEHLAANADSGIQKVPGSTIAAHRYQA